MFDIIGAVIIIIAFICFCGWTIINLFKRK